TIKGGAADFWYFFTWTGFRPRSADLDRPVTFQSPESIAAADSNAARRTDTFPSPPIRDTAPSMIVPPPSLTPPQEKGYVVSFAAVLTAQKASELAAEITINGAHPKVAATQSGGTTVYRVVLGPYATREEAEKVGRDSKRQYWVYEASQ
ncbi:MAG TPA: SPOR domain-containing protein, partial [Gemmatimonadaceae bacterium]|nr:SPOR domain-containing protein [Gemmatimonadaceae bacterium]